MKVYKLVFVLLISFLCQQPSYSQIDFKKAAEEAKQQAEQSRQLDKHQLELIQKYNDYSLKHLQRTFTWNFASSIIIFAVVHIIIMFGLYFSLIQFKNTVVNNKELSNSSIKINKDGLEVSSSVLGVITLMISLVFFYLYIKNIYPITMIDALSPELTNDKKE